jgi:hypothetical protein
VLSLTVALMLMIGGGAQFVAQLPAVIADLRSGAEQVEVAGSPDAPSFLAEARAVTNWRAEAVRDLHPTPLSALAVVLQVERPVVTRCVKLNNYWCIKQARWNGEIGADGEGHVGFATAERGADAAVKLLRRYYLELNRKSALDIVRRWAPAECRVAGVSGAPTALSVRGLGNTLRARWLAARRAKPARVKIAAKDGAVALPQRPAANRVSAVPLRPLPAVSMPSIMAGVSAAKPAGAALLPARMPRRRQPTPASVAAAKAAAAARTPPRPAPTKAPAVTRTAPRLAPANVQAADMASKNAPRSAIAAAPVPPPRPDAAAIAAPLPPPLRPVVTCAPDEQRIQNYAGRIVQGLDLQPGDDLKLFASDGTPLPNLARVLLSMSSFELGHLRASVELVAGAVERATRRTAPDGPNDAAPAAPASVER